MNWEKILRAYLSAIQAFEGTDFLLTMPVDGLTDEELGALRAAAAEEYAKSRTEESDDR